MADPVRHKGHGLYLEQPMLSAEDPEALPRARCECGSSKVLTRGSDEEVLDQADVWYRSHLKKAGAA